ncbi:MAG: dihydroorotate dehydrogenase electron transfer subunit [Myxococcota bacterium]
MTEDAPGPRPIRRAGGEALPPLRIQAQALDHRAEGGPNHRLVLAVESGFSGFAPGQFVMLSPGAVVAAERSDPLLPRPMAIYRVSAGASGGEELEILYKVSGRGTALLREVRPGDRVRVVGPLGRGFPLPAPGAPSALVGGGTGIASLYELAARCAGRSPLAVLLGARSAADLMGVDDFAALGVELEVATEDGSRGHRGVVTALLERRLEASAGSGSVYACGPTPMMQRAAEVADSRGVRCFVSLENHMACGFGVCLGCAVPQREGGYGLVCREGPVFEADRVDWTGLP